MGGNCAGCPPTPPEVPIGKKLPRGRCAQHPRYQAGCRPCQDASAARQRAHTRAKAYGQHRPGNVGAEPVRQHMRHLSEDHQMSLRQIGEAAGVSHACVDRIAAGHSEEVRATTAAKVLAVRPQPPKGGHHIDGAGTARRLQALAAIGYGAVELAPMLGETPAEVSRLRRRHRPHVKSRTAAKVSALYARLEGVHGPSDKARAEARLRNWAPPLAWDDDAHLNNPDRPAPYNSAGVSARIVERAFAGEVPASALNEVERKKVVSRLLGVGLTARQIGDRLSWSGGGRAGRVAVAAYLGRVQPAPVTTGATGRRGNADLEVVDRVAIERALAGERIRLTRLERHLAVHVAVPKLGVTGAATVLRMSGRTVNDLYSQPLPANREEVAA